MHKPPAVCYPLRRSRAQAAVLAVLSLLGLLVLVAWVPLHPDWRGGLIALVWVLGVSGALISWWRTPCALLQWDGQTWTYVLGDQSTPGQLRLQLDLQVCMVLRWTGQGAVAPRWLWPELPWGRGIQAATAQDAWAWHALRVAVAAASDGARV